MSSGATLIRHAVTDEVDGYTSCVAGVELESVRAGRGTGPSRVTAALGDRFTVTSSTVGFPMLTHATIADHVIALNFVRRTSPGSRWCGIDLVPGAVMTYGPEAEHVAVNKPGLEFTFAIIGRDQLLANADGLGIHIELPARGELEVLAPSARVALLGDVFPTFAAIAETGSWPSGRVWDDALRAMVHALSEDNRPVRMAPKTRRIDSRRVIRVCSDYADSIGRIPSISELCLVAHVSERRLRKAFVDEFDMPPSRFFRAWALDTAHRRLLAARDGRHTSVTRIASDLGLAHLGRFSGQYRAIYGELPSMTLRKRNVPT